MDDNRPAKHRTGEAMFINWQDGPSYETDTIWELRQQTKQKFLAGDAPTRYVVTDIVDFYAGVVGAILSSADSMEQYLQVITADLHDETDEVLSCVVFWDLNQNEGVLIHRRGAQWLVAVLPTIDALTAKHEEQVARDLTSLSARTQGIPIRLDRAVGQGRHMLSDVLDTLSEQIDV